MTKLSGDFPGQAFLELLRPPKLATTRLALFASYSADPIVLGGALLHLHSRGRDNGGGNKSDFAGAIEALRDRVRFVVQRGRIHRGPKLPKIAAVLDQFVVEMPYHERENSWHPKLALACYIGPDRRPIWRLWVGSRNLTLSRDLDLGLVLDGEPRRRKGSQRIEGIEALSATLAREAALPEVDPEALANELREVRWTAPDGMDVASIKLWAHDAQPIPPIAENEGRKIVVLSPFLCDAFVATLARVTNRSRDRTLVTTLPALRKLSSDARASLAGFKLLSLGVPDPEGNEVAEKQPAAPDEAATNEEDDSPRGTVHSGLHAKLFAAIRGDRVDIVAGSANATDRAWSGRNAEAVARFSGGKREIDGIAAIVGCAFPIPATLLETLSDTDVDLAQRQLEQIRWQFSEIPLALRRRGLHFSVLCDPPPFLPDGASLEVGLATMPLHPWPRGTQQIELGGVPLSLQTDLVQFRLTIADLPPATWLQRVAVSPPIDGDRDSAAISRFLSVAGLQAWLREMLEGNGGAGTEDDWDAEDGEAGPPAQRQSWKHDGFALEDMLSAWARNDHDKLKRVDGMLDRYVAAVLAHSEHLSEEDRRDLTALQEIWGVARDVMLAKK